jgi:subtilisin family serine protease
VASGVFFALAAGNSASNAANYSPASEPSACTVGASDISDVSASFSNYGALVDVYAPGVDVTSAWNDGGINTISGTSMATPHVAGLGAYLLALENIPTSGLCERIVELANKGAISELPAGTANLLAYNGATS